MDHQKKLKQNILRIGKEHQAEKVKKPESEYITIENDINRTYFNYGDFTKMPMYIKAYKNVLNEIISKMDCPYYQGMSEIVGVIVDAFLHDKILALKFTDEGFPTNSQRTRNLSAASQENLNKIRDFHKKVIEKEENGKTKSNVDLKNEDESSETVEEIATQQEIEFTSENFHFTIESNQRVFLDFKEKEKKLLVDIRKGIEVLLTTKFLPLTDNEFDLYKKYNSVFIKMMKKSNRNIPPMYEFLTAKHILTFFCRDIEKKEDIHRIFNIIIENDIKVSFSILLGLKDKIDITPKQDQQKRCTLSEDFEKQVKENQAAFFEAEKNQLEVNGPFVIAGAVTSAFAIGLAIFYKYKKE